MSGPGFTWVTPILCVDDLPASLAYYTAQLGFELAWSWGEDQAFDSEAHPTFACVCRGDVSVFLSERHQGVPGAWMSLNVGSQADLDALHAEYVASGARIVEPPAVRVWGMREMWVEDLDGNVFRMGCPLG
ncbi:MAG: bleomycin resistance family protein [Deltaproteobacteria bacterium]|nr:MAG: bleomycin resistance family protein [Deltaproteobacteria bacterium]